ncbi:Kinase-like protein [Teratosphaeria destructans]|uniref:Kinase-like protein n=1 Tax=Teratosphaeria destructans TaxID=418781 RepID=A0A9W7W1N2_9PEZI|nr:Kinase-like protein [Teratosphaeria destructans]
MSPGFVEVVGSGTTSFVGLLNNTNTLKYSIAEGEGVKEFEVDAAIYEALGKHPRIIEYLGQTRYGIKLKRGFRLTEHLEDGADLSLKLKWVQ